MPFTPFLRGWGTSSGGPAGFLGSSGWGQCLHHLSCFSCFSCFSCLGGPLPAASPVLPLASFLCPQDQCSRRWGGVCLGGQGTGLELSRLPVPEWMGQMPSSPAPPRGPLPPTCPDLPGLRGADLVWPPLLLPPLTPHILLVHLGVPPISLGIRVPHQWPAGALVLGRR